MGDRALNPNTRVAFRVLCRIADVVEGRPDSLQIEPGPGSLGPTLKEVSEREASMWDRTEIQKMLRSLSEKDKVDRAKEVESFVASNGILTVMRFLSHADGRGKVDELEMQANEAYGHLHRIHMGALDYNEAIVGLEKTKKQNETMTEILPLDPETNEHYKCSGCALLIFHGPQDGKREHKP